MGQSSIQTIQRKLKSGEHERMAVACATATWLVHVQWVNYGGQVSFHYMQSVNQGCGSYLPSRAAWIVQYRWRAAII